MILLDASVVIAYLRDRERLMSNAFTTLDLGVCGVTRAEILHGARDESDRQKLLSVLGQFQAVPIPEALWDKVGQRLAEFRAAGLAVPFADSVLATLAMELGVEIWTRDNHFRLMLQVLPLRLFDETTQFRDAHRP